MGLCKSHWIWFTNRMTGQNKTCLAFFRKCFYLNEVPKEL